jgi:RES domain
MSLSISTLDELRSSARRAAGRAWRVVEAQHWVSTAKLTDTAEEQKLLEDLIEATKPALPPECEHLHFLLATPFRYGAVRPYGSRFRRAGRTPGVFYAAENVDTAIAEACFWRLLFYAESPPTKWPDDAGEFTAFFVEYATERAIDLTLAPFADERIKFWTHLTRYDECQELADLARAAGIEVMRYASVRDPQHKANLALLSCAVFSRRDPMERQTWRILLKNNGQRALCEMPQGSIDFDSNTFVADPRIKAMLWER